MARVLGYTYKMKFFTRFIFVFAIIYLIYSFFAYISLRRLSSDSLTDFPSMTFFVILAAVIIWLIFHFTIYRKINKIVKEKYPEEFAKISQTVPFSWFPYQGRFGYLALANKSDEIKKDPVLKKLIWKHRIISFILLLTAVLIWFSQYLPDRTNLSAAQCSYDDVKEELTCGDDWTMVSYGEEIKVTAFEPLSVPRNTLIALGKPEVPGSTQLFCPSRSGVYEINDETSRRAVGTCMVVQ